MQSLQDAGEPAAGCHPPAAGYADLETRGRAEMPDQDPLAGLGEGRRCLVAHRLAVVPRAAERMEGANQEPSGHSDVNCSALISSICSAKRLR
jgi:hypothetical protein